MPTLGILRAKPPRTLFQALHIWAYRSCLLGACMLVISTFTIGAMHDASCIVAFLSLSSACLAVKLYMCLPLDRGGDHSS